MEEKNTLDQEQMKKVTGGKEIVKGTTPGVCPKCGSSFCGYWIDDSKGYEVKVWFCNICTTEFIVE